MKRPLLSLAIGLAAAASVFASRAALAAEPVPAPKLEQPGSLVTTAPLGRGNIGMGIGGGVAVILPFYAIDVGVGVSQHVDIVGRFETVLGVLHYPRIGVRWQPLQLGRWKLGVGLGANYSFFGIATDQVNLTSTFYLDGELAISGPVTKSTDIFASFDSEFDIFEYNVADGDGNIKVTHRYDAAIFKLGMRTELTKDLSAYLRARLRIPQETFTYQAMSFYVIPSIEVGGTWTF